MTISDQIRVLCARLNISQAELARRMGQSPQGFSAKMKRKSFTVDELDRIADAAGVKFKRAFAFSSGEEIQGGFQNV